MAQPTYLTEQSLLQTTPELQNLERQRQIADLLTAKSQQQPTGELISGRYVKPSWAQQIAPLFNAAIGSNMSNNVDTQQQALAQALRGKQQQETSGIMQALQGTPAQMYPQQSGPTPNGGNIPQQVQTPAQPGNQQQALSLALNAQTPQGQAMVAPLIANVIPKKTEMQQEFELAQQGGFKGTFNDYKNQITPYQKEELKLRQADLGMRGAEMNKGQIVETPQGVMLVNPRTGQTTPVMSNGQPILGKGNLTESQGKAAVFQSQMVGAQNELNDVYSKGFNPNSPISQTTTSLAGGMFNAATPSDAQRAKQAQNQWTEAYLRFKTGAGTNAHEIEANRQTYFPQIGDSPDVVAQKSRMREQAQNDISMAAGPMAGKMGVQSNTQENIPQQGNQNANISAWGKATVVGQ